MFGSKPMVHRSAKKSRSLRLESLETRAMLNAAPVVNDFYVIYDDISNTWTMTGTVTDVDDSVEGYVVTFGAVLGGRGLSAVVDVDGVFCVTYEITDLENGTATAQTVDPHDALSNLARDVVIV